MAAPQSLILASPYTLTADRRSIFISLNLYAYQLPNDLSYCYYIEHYQELEFFLAKSGFYCPQWDHLPNQCPNERASLSSPTSLPSHLFSFIAAFNSSNLIWGMTQWRYHPSLQAVLFKLPPFPLWCPDRTAMEFHVPSPHHPCQLALYSCS